MRTKTKTRKKRRKSSNIKNYYNFSEEQLKKLFAKKRYRKTIEWEDDKAEVRKTKEWLELKCFVAHRQNNLDPLNGRKLPKSANLHHKDYHDENYGVFNSDHFILYSQMSHKCMHYLLSCMHNSKDPKAILEFIWQEYLYCEKLNKDIKTWKQAH